MPGRRSRHWRPTHAPELPVGQLLSLPHRTRRGYSTSGVDCFAAALRPRVFRTGRHAFKSSAPTWCLRSWFSYSASSSSAGTSPPRRRTRRATAGPRTGHDLVEAGKQRNDPFGTPAVPQSAGSQQLEERLRLVLVVPAGPPQHQRGVSVRPGLGVGDEPLLDHVELAAIRPVGRTDEVGRCALRRYGDAEPLPGTVLLALLPPDLLPLRACAGQGPCSSSRRGRTRARR